MDNYVKLSEVADATVGFVGTMAQQYQTTGIPFLRSLNIRPFEIISDDLKYISPDFNEQIRKSILRENDILIVRTGDPGNCCVVPDEYVGANCSDVVIVRPDTTRVDPQYLCTYINYCGKQQIQNQRVGAVQKHFNVRSAEEMLLLIPSVDVQRNVSKVLSTLNKAIEINKQTNAQLQAMVYDCYMHMFYGREANAVLSDVIIEHPKSKVQVGDARGVVGDYPFFTSGASVLQWPSSMVSGRYCLLNSGGNADVKFYVGDAAYSTDTWCISAKGALADYLFTFLYSIRDELGKKFFAGTGLKHLQKQLLKDRPIYRPSDAEIKHFNRYAVPAMTIISDNVRENCILESLRDWLFPMLMNGQVVVKEQ